MNPVWAFLFLFVAALVVGGVVSNVWNSDPAGMLAWAATLLIGGYLIPYLILRKAKREVH